MLTQTQVNQFQHEGYTSVAHLFSSIEISAMRAELDRFKVEGLLRNVTTEGDGQTHSKENRNLQICPITPKSTLFRAFQFHPKVVRIFRQLIGDPFVFYLDQIFLKPPRIGQGTNWHQDNAYFKVSDPSKGAAMWVALHDATIENGTLHVIPGSFQEAYPHQRDPFSDHHICCEVPEERAVAIELPAGGAAFFNFGCAHATRENSTDKERAGLALHFLRTDYIPESEKTRKSLAHISGPIASGGYNEYDSTIDGTWNEEVDRLQSDAKM